MLKFRKLIALIFLMSVAFASQSQAVVGKWKTVDDQTGRERSIVEIYQEGEKYFGKIIKIIPAPGDDPDPVCTECKGKKKGRKINGLVIIEDMELDDDGVLDDGKILDPENGKVYDGKIWVADDGTLKVRGFLLFLYRTQTWLPYEG